MNTPNQDSFAKRSIGVSATLVSFTVWLPLACAPANDADEGARDPHGKPPHIVLFLADDLGWGDVGYHGSEIRTPHIDGLVRDGLELNRFYVQPSCSPTRAALLTGRYPIRYGMQAGILRPWEDRGLDLGERLLPSVLREAGYATHMVGKWHLGSSRVDELPTSRGFDHHYGMYTGKADYFDRLREGALDWHRDGEPLREEGYTTHLLRDEAVRVVEGHEPSRPLFLYVPFSAPHFPLQAPAEEVQAYAQHIHDADRRTYAAMVSCMDEAIGAVLDALERRSMLEETLVVFLSDNGASTAHGGSNGPLAGEKNELGEGGVRVPAVVSWPARLQPRRIEVPMHAVDLFPTLLRLARGGGERPAGSEAELRLDGMDLWATWSRGMSEGELEQRPILVNVASNRGAVVAGRWKLSIDYVARQALAPGDDPLVGTELFDLVEDPGELRNRAAESLMSQRELLAALARFKTEMVPSPPDRPSRLPAGFELPDAWGPR